MQDFRFYRVVEAVSSAFGSRKGTLSPGTVFPSLAELRVTEDAEESEEDFHESYQQIRSMLSQVAQRSSATP